MHILAFILFALVLITAVFGVCCEWVIRHPHEGARRTAMDITDDDLYMWMENGDGR